MFCELGRGHLLAFLFYHILPYQKRKKTVDSFPLCQQSEESYYLSSLFVILILFDKGFIILIQFCELLRN